MTEELLKQYESAAMGAAALIENLLDNIRDMPAPDSDDVTLDDLRRMQNVYRRLAAAARVVNLYA